MDKVSCVNKPDTRSHLHLNELSYAERKIMSTREREKGNEYFNVFENDEAMSCYCNSIILDESNEKSYANRAAVFIRQSKFDLAIDDCTKALEINPFYVKAIARRAMCYHKIGNFREAVSNFEACRKLDVSANYDRLMQRSMKKLEECASNEHDDGAPSGRDGALDAEQSLLSNISPQNSNGISQPVTFADASPNWHKMSIIETEITDDDKIEESVSCTRRMNIAEEIDSECNDHRQNTSMNQCKDLSTLKKEGNYASKNEPKTILNEKGLNGFVHASGEKKKVRRHDSQALAF